MFAVCWLHGPLPVSHFNYILHLDTDVVHLYMGMQAYHLSDAAG